MEKKSIFEWVISYGEKEQPKEGDRKHSFLKGRLIYRNGEWVRELPDIDSTNHSMVECQEKKNDEAPENKEKTTLEIVKEKLEENREEAMKTLETYTYDKETPIYLVLDFNELGFQTLSINMWNELVTKYENNNKVNIVADTEIEGRIYVTTLYGVIQENGWDDDLKYYSYVHDYHNVDPDWSANCEG
jgi:hypothetical protein